ncbi:MAG: hypothetical protein A2W52_03855 [Candidatus Taylorbacteria bacterium RIFCSPHIGHO2_02_49_25]|uniref:Uncharacterized protein n=1 Tax=Candidatus Taylorbacteria bacterium RIFCSPHIGHO2_02_49_25 TaxID=1802305 RepID=A0A1G2MF56_9BACT|nr:MAG: hypothetical protein A2W52_03855 [Candidatus Taylorbacteria bacterium RIFCSPHIGHO2_02_49_25]OHA36751.1 MAG: hypothetical protein A2W65_01985 [Candidatus Taylorbacteria bacterium RIFCSPLOWO2_02_50_13]OHA41127.1 MAG: hypothetical protein A3H73_02705 [Candidatus Taylorbacteria bacterium RIFCSPLOWO2_02_FULL_50_120]OHA47793.1 MAG: hypothetical protein A3G61_03230 [Candidatus Taylorbacteria bacterium RIFCSPLOWO2_12_FULL_49_67]
MSWILLADYSARKQLLFFTWFFINRSELDMIFLSIARSNLEIKKLRRKIELFEPRNRGEFSIFRKRSDYNFRLLKHSAQKNHI